MRCDTCNLVNRSVGNQCRNCYQKAYYLKNKSKLLEQDKQRKRISYNKNRDKLIARCSDYYKNNSEKILKDKREYHLNNRDRINARKRKYYRDNRDKIVKNNVAYIVKRSKVDVAFKIARNLRSRLNKAVRGNFKSGSAVDDLGCSIKDFKKYLESKFTGNMSWDNYGLKGWHIDHIVPLVSFDLEDRDQLLEACRYTNLQPLWAVDNIKKGSSNEIS